jgi:hypothetical protein
MQLVSVVYSRAHVLSPVSTFECAECETDAILQWQPMPVDYRYAFAKRLKTLRGLTPYECICNAWADEPHRFRYNPTHLTSGLNT